MKQLLTILAFILISSLQAQETIKVQDRFDRAGNITPIELYSLDSNSMYYLDFGDGSNTFIDKKSEFNVRHTYNNEGSYTLVLFKIADGGKTEVAKLTISQVAYTKLHITKITIKDYYPVKADGDSWDNSFGNNYPDPYLYIVTNGTSNIILNNYNEKKLDLKPRMEASWSFNNLTILKSDITSDVSFAVYDYDSVTNHDLLGGITLKKENVDAYFYKKQGTASVQMNDTNNCSFDIEYKWE